MYARFSRYLISRKNNKLQAWVDPNKVLYPKYQREWPWYVKNWPWLFCPGNWDQYNSLHLPFREAELRGLLQDGANYRKTQSYKRLIYELNTEGRTRFPRCESLEDIDNYFQKLYFLYDDMKKNGYKASTTTRAEGDIDVRISRKGEFLKCGQGTHRLAVARILNLPNILITVDLIHIGWVNYCEKEFQCNALESVRKWIIVNFESDRKN